jgi:molybdopterin-guanine dinucleotide biosynthesis protein
LGAAPSLVELVAEMPEVDIILVEGFGRDTDSPRIEVVRSARSQEPLNAPQDVLAYVTDLSFEGAPCYGLDDADGVADLLETRFLKPSP